MEIIKAENVTFSYNERKDVIKNVSLSINEGEYIAIVGKNGSGKSTFAKLFNGLFKVDDMNSIARTEDVLSHLGIPKTGLVTEMATSLKHFAHAYGHVKSPRLKSNVKTKVTNFSDHLGYGFDALFTIRRTTTNRRTNRASSQEEACAIIEAFKEKSRQKENFLKLHYCNN